MSQKINARTTELSEPAETALPDFFSSLCDMIPSDVILIRIEHKSTYAAYSISIKGVGSSRGILCFSTHAIASQITRELFPNNTFTMEDHTLESALVIARTKCPPINCLLLFDNPKKPVVHYVN